MNKTMTAVVLTLILALPGTAIAQDKVVAEQIDAAKKEQKEKKELEDGWQNTLSLGANFSLSSSQNVVGNPDGTAMQFGVLLSGTGNYKKGNHKWLNEGKLVHSQTRTSIIPVFVKSADELNLKSTYFYSPEKIKWAGPFGRLTLNTALFPGYYVGAIDAEIMNANVDLGADLLLVDDDNVMAQYTAPEKYPTTSAFEPLIVKQVMGALANPINRGKKFNLAFHLGVGAEEFLSRGGYVVSEVKQVSGTVVESLDDTNGDGEVDLDDDLTVVREFDNAVKLKPLLPYQNLGTELELNVTGTINEYVAWSATITFFKPFVTVTDTELEGTGFAADLNQEHSAKISVKLAKWASMDLVGSAKYYPYIVETWQFQTGLLFTTTFNVL